MNTVKLVTLDKRHSGHEHWKYYVQRPRAQPFKESKQVFHLWWEWCWQQWGSSKEMNTFDNDDLFDGVVCSNPHWSWQTDERTNRCRIYLRGDAEASMFMLSWI